MRIATPQLTCSQDHRARAVGDLRRHLDAAVDRPRVHHDRVGLRVRERALRQPERARQLARVREPRRLALEPLVLDAQHHHDVGAVEAVLEPRAHAHALAREVAADQLDAARDQRARRDQPHARAELGEAQDVRARDARVRDVADDRDLEARRRLPLCAADRRGVEQRLRRVLVLAVAGVDRPRTRACFASIAARAAERVAHDDRRPGASPAGCGRCRAASRPWSSTSVDAEMLIASADRRFAASSNDVRVRVELSKNRLITVRPRSVVSFLIGSSASAQKRSPWSRMRDDLRGVEVGDADEVPARHATRIAGVLCAPWTPWRTHASARRSIGAIPHRGADRQGRDGRRLSRARPDDAGVRRLKILKRQLTTDRERARAVPPRGRGPGAAAPPQRRGAARDRRHATATSRTSRSSCCAARRCAA